MTAHQPGLRDVMKMDEKKMKMEFIFNISNRKKSTVSPEGYRYVSSKRDKETRQSNKNLGCGYYRLFMKSIFN